MLLLDDFINDILGMPVLHRTCPHACLIAKKCGGKRLE